MRYLLDTNICIYCINERYPQLFDRVLLRHQSHGIGISSISKAEMLAGSYRGRSPARYRQEQDEFFSHFPSLPFDDPAADAYGRIHAYLRDRGQLMGVADMQIAAVAMANALAIVTHDKRGFMRLPDLLIEDWTIK
ncbi:MAG: type II toxin-antitoxin system VapC family toxin [Chloroflexi bacterium]|nr:type II toxin-antitoxin system VapC family toxin [Chloroflexota bacterium]MCY3581862.1 type II toxin-antitoxin system VapC family toxin [Chloroflexota bacterium]MCY3716508.1 type II toxin-antitoxin system VapC family toxin [Chloroflexota bacterium]MDE2651602.1 type II toxin-antitoxin system VapC family toxin [Chloroflexota bacterium]MXX50898.1 type II toxin-antitoxin system VapC family toxin [Chloroflexota bacterium]